MRSLRIVAAAVLVLVAASGCTADHYGAGERYVIAGGSATGVYFNYGQHLAEKLSQRFDASFVVAETAGSVDNLLRIGSGEADVGFAQSDAAADAVAGVGAFQEPLPIRAMARLYDEYVHVVVRADSSIERIADFENRVVSLGANNSGVALIATRLLDAAGVDLGSIENRELGLEASIAALQNAEIDGFFWVGGLPTPGIVQLGAEVPIRLLSIDPETVNLINGRHAGIYRVAEFPVGAYGLEQPTSTMTVPNLLVAGASVPDEVVYDILDVLFDSRLEIAQSVPAAALLDRRQAIFTDPLELHPGAVEYYSTSRR
jgi:TRAP transporter TAXI family solute receptor